MIDLDAASLALMREVIPLPESCVISQPTRAYSAGAAGTVTYTPSGTVSARRDPAGAAGLAVLVDLIAGREAMRVDFILTLPWSADIDEDCHVTIGGDEYALVSLTRKHSSRVCIRAKISKVG